MSNSQEFGAYSSDDNKVRYYNCAPVKQRKEDEPSKDEAFGVFCDSEDERKFRYYNCAPVKQRKSLTPSVASDKDLQVNKDEVFGVFCDDDNKIHYYNCAPIKQKKTKKASDQPIRKMFTRLFGNGDATPSGSDLSLSSTDSSAFSKS